MTGKSFNHVSASQFSFVVECADKLKNRDCKKLRRY